MRTDLKAYVSWNGATGVAAWQVVGGATVPRSSFETTLPLSKDTKIVVRALDAAGNVLGESLPT